MYQVTLGEATLFNAALAKALAAAKSAPHPIVVAEDVAQQFLTREILRLYREGQHDRDALKDAAIGLLRNYVQAQESSIRLANTRSLS